MKTLRTFTAAAALALGLGGAAQSATIAEIAAGDDRFETLLAAVQAAGLADTLAGPGTFTVFAPTDDAFDALPAGTVEALVQPENIETLTKILTFHVAGQELPAAAIPAGSTFIRPLFDSARLCVTASADGVTLRDGSGTPANVVITDIEADNGVIHVIDKVLIPSGTPDCH